jgi:hypothetical protein
MLRITEANVLLKYFAKIYSRLLSNELTQWSNNKIRLTEITSDFERESQ